MDRLILEHYANDHSRLGELPEAVGEGAAGGSTCGDLVTISLGAEGGHVAVARHRVSGCAAARAAAAAACELIEGTDALAAARIGEAEIAAALGGLSAQGSHAATLAADALHRALGVAAASGGFEIEPSPERVLVAMSGGVDSSVVAHLARQRGSEPVGVTVKLWSDPAGDGERSCCSPQAVLGARGVAHSLGMAHLTLDLEPAFRAGVVEPFIAGYAAGETPNPCVRCNGSVRIEAMVELADRIGARSLLTGHYARIVDDGDGLLLRTAVDPAKDQSYMLAALDPAVLARLELPLAELRKPEVRALAAEAGLEAAKRPDSQDLCFLAGVGKREFLRRHGGLGTTAGEIVDADGRVIGSHGGQHEFTIGQRRGLGVASAQPLYVLARDATANQVTVGPRERLERRTVELRAATLHRAGGRVNRIRLRYHAPTLGCRIEPAEADPGEHDALLARLSEPASGVAPGQAAALMDGEAVVGHATIA